MRRSEGRGIGPPRRGGHPFPGGRTLLRTWLAAGALALGYGLMASGCTPATPVAEPIAPVGEIDSLETAEQAWRAGRIAEYEPIWNEENGPDGDPFAAGVAAFNLASATRDPAWSNAAIDAFDTALANDPELTLARAWRGSAHALMARDYPVKGFWQIVPGPGFVRLYHARAAFSDLDSAVGAAPGDPVVRLIRGSTYLGMPSVFGGGEEGLADFGKLRAWTRDPDANPDHADILRSRGWREQYYFSRLTPPASPPDSRARPKSIGPEAPFPLVSRQFVPPASARTHPRNVTVAHGMEWSV